MGRAVPLGVRARALRRRLLLRHRPYPSPLRSSPGTNRLRRLHPSRNLSQRRCRISHHSPPDPCPWLVPLVVRSRHGLGYHHRQRPPFLLWERLLAVPLVVRAKRVQGESHRPREGLQAEREAELVPLVVQVRSYPSRDSRELVTYPSLHPRRRRHLRHPRDALSGRRAECRQGREKRGPSRP